MTWGNATLVEFNPLFSDPLSVKLGLLVVCTFVAGMFFCLVMVGGYWWSSRTRVAALHRRLRSAHQELDELRTQEIRVGSA